ncbi:MAG: phosphopantetheine-binding protein [Peptococcaceae bacterium]|jgi:acyl carrier protein|nr:phosphopantetheine-binding protein [Peptococcaceae bacterium]
MLDKITQIVNDYTSNQELDITEQTTFADLALDSLDTVELLMKIEEEFSVRIEMSEDIKSVGDLIKIIESAQ